MSFMVAIGVFVWYEWKSKREREEKKANIERLHGGCVTAAAIQPHASWASIKNGTCTEWMMIAGVIWK